VSQSCRGLLASNSTVRTWLHGLLRRDLREVPGVAGSAEGLAAPDCHSVFRCCRKRNKISRAWSINAPPPAHLKFTARRARFPSNLAGCLFERCLGLAGGLTANRRSLPRSLRNRMQEHLTPDLPIASASATEPLPQPLLINNATHLYIHRHRHQRRCSSQISTSAGDSRVSIIASRRLAFLFCLFDRPPSRPA
jgi:hypothetical protein